MAKYHNKKTIIDGIVFDSAKEARRYQELVLLQRAGEISDLQRQVPFVLIPSQMDENGKVVERPVRYVADFVYFEKGIYTVEDVKGVRTKEYVIKRKLMYQKYNIRVKEV